MGVANFFLEDEQAEGSMIKHTVTRGTRLKVVQYFTQDEGFVPSRRNRIKLQLDTTFGAKGWASIQNSDGDLVIVNEADDACKRYNRNTPRNYVKCIFLQPRCYWKVFKGTTCGQDPKWLQIFE